MADPSPEAKARRIKNDQLKLLLSSYYKDGANSSAPSSPTHEGSPVSRVLSPKTSGFSNREASLDASFFDSETYLQRIIRDLRLGELADKHRQLVTEVATLDSDMHMLVYENYNKFITATDIMKSMNVAVAGLDERLRQLEDLIGGVVEKSETINGKLDTRQAAIEEMNQLRMILYKLQIAMHVPKKMKLAIDHGAYDLAADVYADAAPLLARYGYRQALNAAAKETETHRKHLVGILRSALNTRPEDAAENIRLIAKLGEPTESLQEDFLASQSRRLAAILEKADDNGSLESSLTATATNKNSLDDSVEVLKKLQSDFSNELIRTATLFNDLFPVQDRPKLLKLAREMLLRYLRLVTGALAACSLAAAQHAVVAKNDDELTQRGENGAAFWSAGASVKKDWGVGRLIRYLYVVYAELPKLDRVLPELGGRDKAAEVVENALRNHIGQCFSALEASVRSSITLVGENLSSTTTTTGSSDTMTTRSPSPQPQQSQQQQQAALLQAVSALKNSIFDGIESLVLGLHEFGSEQWILADRHEEFLNLVLAQVLHLVGSIPNIFIYLSSSSGSSSSDKNNTNTSLLIVLWRLSYLIRNRLPEHAQEQIMKLQGLLPPRLQFQQMPINELSRKYIEASNGLLTRYVEVQACSLGEVIIKAVDGTDWKKYGEPAGISKMCSRLLNTVSGCENQLHPLFNLTEADLIDRTQYNTNNNGSSQPSPFASHQYSRSQISSTTSGGSMTFSGKEGGYHDGLSGGGNQSFMMASAGSSEILLEETIPGILSVILLRGLKSLVASLHQKVLNKNAFQQIQLDCHCMRPQLQRLVSGAAASMTVLQLLDEITATAAERCSEPRLLEPAALDRLAALGRS